MSNIDKYTKFMSEQAKTASTGLFGTHKNGFVTEQVRNGSVPDRRSLEESKNDHIVVSHPIETLHSGDNENRTGKPLTDDEGDFSKEYHNQARHYKQILKKLKTHKDANVHDGYEDEAGHVSFKKGSAAHEAVKEHLPHVDHSSASRATHKSGPGFGSLHPNT